jgi:hypothetical protein
MTRSCTRQRCVWMNWASSRASSRRSRCTAGPMTEALPLASRPAGCRSRHAQHSRRRHLAVESATMTELERLTEIVRKRDRCSWRRSSTCTPTTRIDWPRSETPRGCGDSGRALPIASSDAPSAGRRAKGRGNRHPAPRPVAYTGTARRLTWAWTWPSTTTRCSAVQREEPEPGDGRRDDGACSAPRAR